jgi:hypothetical protein
MRWLFILLQRLWAAVSSSVAKAVRQPVVSVQSLHSFAALNDATFLEYRLSNAALLSPADAVEALKRAKHTFRAVHEETEYGETSVKGRVNVEGNPLGQGFRVMYPDAVADAYAAMWTIYHRLDSRQVTVDLVVSHLR